ncbi:GMC family oxidoreductase [Sphingomonas sp. HMP6]|uniref:GMC family oxidoreductase n=1 Tax=Sphingomonas sp. HMP6 TaxID=1517551 RepID=UPI0015969D30|nr:GMC oxidoreductase [Sphingomonas sp. HMP6]BCA60751.1 hypothetical protein HMP06_3520 [Sphingomonas sp. HMP6]
MKFLDLENPRSSVDYNAEICIVGAGPAGVTIASELVRSGISVILVESGGLTEESETHALYDGDTIGERVRMMEGRHRVYGGAATRWNGRCAPLDPIDFEVRDWIPLSGWPFRYADFSPWYERAKELSNFAGHWIDDDVAVRRLGAAPRPFNGGKLQRMVWRVASSENQPGRKTLLKRWHRKFFDYGAAYRSKLKESATTQVLLHANLVAMRSSEDGSRVTEINVATLQNRRATIRANHFVLATSGIENARQLLLTPPALLARINAHSNVGRYFGQHPRGTIGRIIASPAQARRIQRAFNCFMVPDRVPVQYQVGFALTEAAQRDHGLVNASGSLIYRANSDAPWRAAKRLANSLRGRPFRDTARDVAGLITGLPDIVRNVARRQLFGRHFWYKNPEIYVELYLEQIPNAESRILLSPRRDRFGNRLASADWRILPIERQTARFFADAVKDEFQRMDLGRFEGASWLDDDFTRDPDDLVGIYHLISTTRMDADPAKGVVDANCRVHGVENLYCAGASVFATGGHANPTLTIVALAARLAAHLEQIARGGTCERSPKGSV